MDLGIDAGISNNSYQWYKGGVAFGPPTNSNTLVFDPVTFAAAGVYHCQVTNPDAPELTLYSRAKTITVSCGVSVYNYMPEVCDDFEITLDGILYNIDFPCGSSTPDELDQYGCPDSLINVCLQFIQPTTTVIDTTVCIGESITVNGTVYDGDTPTGMDTLRYNISGCDSLIFDVQLGFFDPAISNHIETICYDDTLVLHGQSFYLDEANRTSTSTNSGIQLSWL